MICGDWGDFHRCWVLFTACAAGIAAAIHRKCSSNSAIKSFDAGFLKQVGFSRHTESYMLHIQANSTPQSDQLLLDLRSSRFPQVQLFRLILANHDVLFGKKQLSISSLEAK